MASVTDHSGPPADIRYCPEVIDTYKARITELEKALRPFAAAVYNDNGDVTVTTSNIHHAQWLHAYDVYRKGKP